MSYESNAKSRENQETRTSSPSARITSVRTKNAVYSRMFAPRKSLGQHFLRDENIVRKIIRSLPLAEGDDVLEIGPGQGALTKPLSALPVHLCAVDVDPRSVEFLRATLGGTAKILQQNILEVDLGAFAQGPDGRVHVVGNIPYHLTSEIFFWILDQRDRVADATLMVQLEVAQRLAAGPGTKAYGVLSVFAQRFTECRMLFKVSRNCFVPRPDVDSAVVQLRMRPPEPDLDEALYRSVVRTTFGHRRKTLRNGLKSLGCDEAQIDAIAFDLTLRPEHLSAADFAVLTSEVARVHPR